MEKIHTQAGVAQSQIAGLSKGVLQLAGQVGVDPDSLAESLYHVESAFSSLGITGPKALNLVKIAAEGAKVGGADIVDVTNALGAAVASNIPGVQNYSQAMGALNAIVGSGDMHMQDLAEAFGTGMVAVVKGFGLSLTDVGAALATFGDNNIRGADAATDLRMSVMALAVPSAAGKKILDGWGVSADSLAKDMQNGGLLPALEHLQRLFKANGVTAKEQGQEITDIFGKKAGTGINVLMDQLNRVKSKYPEITKGASNFGSAVAANNKTAAQQFDMLKGTVDALGIRLGLDLLPPVTKFVGWLNKTGVPGVAAFTKKVAGIIPVSAIEQDVKKAEQWVKNLFGMGGEKAPKITPRIDLSNEGLFTKTATLKVKPQVDIQNEGLFTHTPVLKTTPQIDLQNEGIFTKTAPAASKKASDSITSMIKKVNWGKVFTSIIDSAISDAQVIGAEFVKLLGKINWTSLGGSLATVMVGLAVGLVNGLVPALINEAIHHPLDMLMFLASLIPIGRAAGILIDIFDKIPLLGPLVRVFLGPVEKAGGLVEKGLGKVLKKVFGPVGDKIGAAVGDAKSWLLGKGESALLGLWYGAEDGWRAVSGFLGKIGGKILKPFAKAGSWLLGKGKDILSGLGDGIWTGAKAIGGWLYKYIWKPVTGYFVKGGSWLLGKGRDIIQGLGSGIWDRARSIGTWLYKYVWKPLTDYFVKGATWLYQRGSDIIQGLGTGIWNRARSVGTWLYRYIYKPLTGYFAKGGSWLWNHGWDLIQGLFNGITGRLKGISSWVKNNIVNPIITWVKHHFGIKSPSTVFHGIGFNMIAGLLRGIIAGDPLGAIKKIFGSAPRALAGLLEHGIISAAKLPGKAISALKGLGSSVLAGLGSALSGAKGLGSDLLGLLGFGGGGGGISTSGVANSSAYAALKSAAAKKGWTGAQWNALNYVEMREAGYSLTATNPSSGAYGMAQFINGPSEYAQYGGNSTTAAGQAVGMVNYIAQRYGNPIAAAAHERAFNWYAKGLPGQIFSTPTLIGVGEGTRPEKVTVTPLGANYGGSDGAAAPLIGSVTITPQQGPTVDEAMGQLLFTMRRARQAGFPRR
jgi:TP901 family phage tail tape measure protein